MSGVGFPEQAELLREVIDIYEVLLDPRVTPAIGSPAAAELEAARAAEWGEEPVWMAYGWARFYFQAAVEHGKAIAMLTTADCTAIPAMVLARALVEVAGQAWWLLEPEIGAVRRVQRLQLLRCRSAYEGERAAQADGVSPDAYHEYSETMAEVEEYSRQLGLALPARSRRGTYDCGGDQLPSATSLTAGLFAKLDVPGLYNLYSGYSHGHPFALRRDFLPLGRSEIGFQPTAIEESFMAAVAVSSYAIYPAAERLTGLFGLAGPERPSL
jgi:hypothetical protein